MTREGISFTFRALAPLFGNGAGTFRIGKSSVVSTKIGKKYNVLCMKFLCQTDITYKQTKQTVKHCNNNRAICVCFVFFLSFELATSPSCNFQIEDV